MAASAVHQVENFAFMMVLSSLSYTRAWVAAALAMAPRYDQVRPSALKLSRKACEVL